MKIVGLLLSFFITYYCIAQTTKTISYSNIPSQSAQGCFFNYPGASINIGGYAHVGVVGGVDYTGSEFVLNADNTGAGTGYGIYASFDMNHSYTVVVLAKATSTTMRLFGVASPVRGGIPNSCSPGPANTVLQSPNQYTTTGNIDQTYSNYTVLNNYIPTSTGVNYLLFSAFNTVGSIGNVQIQAVYITSTPLNCPAATITNSTVVAAAPNLNFTISFTPTNASNPVNSYNMLLQKYGYFQVGAFTYTIPIGQPTTYTNVSSPYTFSQDAATFLRRDGARYVYWTVQVGSECNGEYKYSNQRAIFQY